MQALQVEVEGVLTSLKSVFVNSDPLLVAQSSVPIYAFVFKRLNDSGKGRLFSRTKLEQFNAERTANRKNAEIDIAKAQFTLLEYDRLSLQGTNDASSIIERWRLLEEWLKAHS